MFLFNFLFSAFSKFLTVSKGEKIIKFFHQIDLGPDLSSLRVTPLGTLWSIQSAELQAGWPMGYPWGTGTGGSSEPVSRETDISLGLRQVGLVVREEDRGEEEGGPERGRSPFHGSFTTTVTALKPQHALGQAGSKTCEEIVKYEVLSFVVSWEKRDTLFSLCLCLYLNILVFR